MRFRWWTILFILFALLVVAGVTARGFRDRSADPSSPAGSDSSFTLAGVEAPIRIATDRWGIPHVRAESLSDLYFGWGFVTARDRLWQLEITRRGARGELWEWFGNRALRDDGGAQLFEIAARARRVWEREARDPKVREPVERFTAGVNAYLDLCRREERPWPEEFLRLGRRPDPWRPEDCVLLLLAQGLVLDLQLPELEEARTIERHGERWLAERERFEDEDMYVTIPDSAALRLYGGRPLPKSEAAGRPPEEAPTLAGSNHPSAAIAARLGPDLLKRARRSLGGWHAPSESDARASNVFAVGPDRGAMGRPLLANDPHLTLRAPGPLYAIHVSVPGMVEAAGACVPGLPAIVSGRNPTCAWGITSLSADVIDVYADSLSADGRRVWSNGTWADVREEAFTMRYRVLGMFSVPLFGRSRRYTPHGPVLALDRKRRVALSARWAGSDDDVTLARILGVERSPGAPQVAECFRSLVTPGLNVVAIDSQGRVIYQAVGAVPRRDFTPRFGTLPGDGRHEWLGVLDESEMPRWQAPPHGFVVNSNNLPVGAAFPEPWPRFEWAHDRAARIAQRLAGDDEITLEDLASVQNDVHSLGAARLVPDLLRCADSLAADLTPRQRAALDTLRGWGFVADRERVAPTLFRAWYGALLRRSDFAGVPGLLKAALDGRAPEWLREPRGRGLERAAVTAVKALELALDEMEKKLGPDLSGWRWSRAHQARFAHALAWRDSALQPPLVPADGDNSTPCVGRSSLPWRIDFTHGAAFRHVVDLATADSSLAVVPPGNSGDLSSGHARDHLALWADHRYVPLYLSWERIESVVEHDSRLLPAGSSAARAAAAPR